MIEVLVNSYVTVEEADEYVNSRFASTSECLKKWLETSDNDKEVALINATSVMESFVYTGVKLYDYQELSFPRKKSVVPFFGCIINIPFIPQTFDGSLVRNSYINGDDGLKSAKECCVQIAVNGNMYSDSEIQSVTKTRLSGIKSRSVDVISETYDYKNGFGSNIYKSIAKTYIDVYLSRWITGTSVVI